MKYLYQIKHVPVRKKIGNKAQGLRKMLRQGFAVPEAWIIPSDLGKKYLQEPSTASSILSTELGKQIDENKNYAVRSSSALEDGSSFSYAGQFTTVLNVSGLDALLDAVLKVWGSSDAGQKGLYGQQTGAGLSIAPMAVIIQEMVDVKWSGVAFSIHPVTGRNEILIEGVQGSAEKLVQDGINPERWVFHQGSWDSMDASKAPPIEVLDSLILGIQHLRKLFDGEVDVEWGWDGEELWYLQCRSITTGKFPTIYSNHISREVLPGMIKPLIWSINIPVVNSAWIRLLSGMLGRLNIQPEQLSSSFYYRAYFNMGTMGALFQMMGLPRDALESMMGRKDPGGKSSFKPSLKTMRFVPRMTIFLLSNINLESRFKRKIRKLNEEAGRMQKLLEEAPENYLTAFRQLHDLSREAAYWNIIVPLAMQITNRVLQKKLQKRGFEFKSLDFIKDFPELKDYDPQVHLQQLREIWKLIPEEERDNITSFQQLESSKLEIFAEFRDKMRDFVRVFGHFSENGNDFSSVPWRENPQFLFDMIRNPIFSENEVTKETSPTSQKENLPHRAYQRAGKYRLYREMISSAYTNIYGMFRTLFLKSGDNMVKNGYLKDSQDVFYLTLEEFERLLDSPGEEEIKALQLQIRQVKEEIEKYRDIALPAIIYGEAPPPITAAHETIYRGIPVSPGIFEGQIVVVKGYSDFKKPVAGKILVIPFSDVGWTPILSNAGAIVAESGGILSHASIVARELGLPAISSVDHACNLKDGSKARVDANHGVLILK